MNPLFLADSFGKSFGRVTVLKSASVWARAGSVTVLLGRNGSGKTTLIRAALGLLRCEHGSVHFAGTLHQRPRLWRLASEGLFYLPQRDLLSSRMRFRDHLGLLSSRFEVEDPEGAAERLGVGAHLDAFPREMSGGERRRAELTLAVARRPTCLLADEPLAEVEPKDRGLVGEVLRELARSGVAVLVTGHEVRDLMDFSDEVIWMTAGTTHGLGSPEEAVSHDQFQREYLGRDSA